MKTEFQGGNTKQKLTPGMTMLAASTAGVITLALTNPIWVVKTRLEQKHIHTSSFTAYYSA